MKIILREYGFMIMETKYMRMILMFDLPIETKSDRRNYRIFRKYIIESGFVMLQKSIYTKIVLNPTKAKTTLENIKKNAPSDGLLQILTITERQYNQMELLVGEVNDTVVNDRNKVVIL